MVVNLDPYTVAITQNFCSPLGLCATLKLLRESPALVSGIKREGGGDDDDRAAVRCFRLLDMFRSVQRSPKTSWLRSNRPESEPASQRRP